jgi:hypothetical protein
VKRATHEPEAHRVSRAWNDAGTILAKRAVEEVVPMQRHSPAPCRQNIRFGLAVAAGALCAPMLGGCEEPCYAAVVVEKTTVGTGSYTAPDGTVVDADFGAMPWLQAALGTPAYVDVVYDGKVELVWSAPADGGSANARTFSLRLGVDAPGERPLREAGARFCACPGTEVPTPEEQCQQVGAVPSGPAECEEVEGTLRVDALLSACVDDLEDVCAEWAIVGIDVPAESGKRFSGSIQLRSMQAVEEHECPPDPGCRVGGFGA